jgi:DNA repair protein RadC
MKEVIQSIFCEQTVQYLLQEYTPRQLINAPDSELDCLPIRKSDIKRLKSYLHFAHEFIKPFERGKILKSPSEVNEHMRSISFADQEVFYGLYLDTKNQLLDTRVISIGTLSATLVHPREFYSVALKLRASGTIAVHSHPSGVPEPSQEDINVTKILADSAKILQLNFLDHIVLGGKSYVSFKERGLL